MTQVNPVFSVTEAARFLGLRPQTLYNKRCYGRGPVYYKIGRRVLYRLADLEKYLAEHRVDPQALAGGVDDHR
jgi:hypothetical protein